MCSHSTESARRRPPVSVSCSVLTSLGELQLEQLSLHELFASSFPKSGPEEALSGANQVNRGGQVSLPCPSFQIKSEQKVCYFLQSEKKQPCNFQPATHVCLCTYTCAHAHTHTCTHKANFFKR